MQIKIYPKLATAQKGDGKFSINFSYLGRNYLFVSEECLCFLIDWLSGFPSSTVDNLIRNQTMSLIQAQSYKKLRSWAYDLGYFWMIQMGILIFMYICHSPT